MSANCICPHACFRKSCDTFEARTFVPMTFAMFSRPQSSDLPIYGTFAPPGFSSPDCWEAWRPPRGVGVFAYIICATKPASRLRAAAPSEIAKTHTKITKQNQRLQSATRQQKVLLPAKVRLVAKYTVTAHSFAGAGASDRCVRPVRPMRRTRAGGL